MCTMMAWSVSPMCGMHELVGLSMKHTSTSECEFASMPLPHATWDCAAGPAGVFSCFDSPPQSPPMPQRQELKREHQRQELRLLVHQRQTACEKGCLLVKESSRLPCQFAIVLRMSH